jgi:hypothetical protein
LVSPSFEVKYFAIHKRVQSPLVTVGALNRAGSLFQKELAALLIWEASEVCSRC